MTATAFASAVRPGQTAPSFRLPMADGSGSVSLTDYHGETPLLLALFIGLWCPFCRRAITQLGLAGPQLKKSGVETLCVVATSPENARLYFRFRPSSLRVAADPNLTTHQAYGVPKPEVTSQLLGEMEATRINPHGMLPEALPIPQAAAVAAQLDGYQETSADHADMQRQWPQLKGQFLIDREGIVRWNNIECAEQGLAGVGEFPTTEAILAAIRTTLETRPY